ncbi:MAG: metallophosphoesterase [Chitinophagales bacterium]|nr:metallophosphoesterase [Chitinophagales bacterium]
MAFILIALLLFIVTDIYFYKVMMHYIVSDNFKLLFRILFFIIASIPYITLAVLYFKGYREWSGWTKNLLMGISEAYFLTKIFMLVFFLITDIIFLFQKLFSKPNTNNLNGNGITRLQFFYKASLVVGTTVFASTIYGILRGAYHLNITRNTIRLKQIPSNSKGIKLAHISDMHLGSFANTNFIQKLVDTINKEQVDFLLFTGDLVNVIAKEAFPYKEIFKNIKTKYGVYSIYGNHDYGNYKEWDNEADLLQNNKDFLSFQQSLGWRVLQNEHEVLNINNLNIGLIGVHYIGSRAYNKSLGDLHLATNNMPATDVKLLLSHDPSHWDMEVNSKAQYQDIDITFSGHTHGFQFGVEIPSMNIKWSPFQALYKQWAGWYQKGEQYLNVNRGIGFIGYPGRIGMPPELSIIEIKGK